MEQVLEEVLWEAFWTYMCVPEVLQMLVTAQKRNDVSKYGPCCELFFFLMKHGGLALWSV